MVNFLCLVLELMKVENLVQCTLGRFSSLISLVSFTLNASWNSFEKNIYLVCNHQNENYNLDYPAIRHSQIISILLTRENKKVKMICIYNKYKIHLIIMDNLIKRSPCKPLHHFSCIVLYLGCNNKLNITTITSLAYFYSTSIKTNELWYFPKRSMGVSMHWH